jgi:hypothetical protein
MAGKINKDTIEIITFGGSFKLIKNSRGQRSNLLYQKAASGGLF